MPDIVLFHSILGLRAAERHLKTVFEADGHPTTLPDLYGGRTTEDYEKGDDLYDETGETLIMEWAGEALDRAPEDAVLAGISIGCHMVGQFWGERPRILGALLFAGRAEWAPTLRPGLPVQAHIARPDRFERDESLIEKWAKSNPEIELHRYDGVGHFFLDRNLPDFNGPAAELCLERCRQFLGNLPK